MTEQTSSSHLEDIISDMPEIFSGRSILISNSKMIYEALERNPPLTYDQISKVLNEKFKREGRLNLNGKPLTVTRQAVNSFVLRRVAKAKKLAKESPTLRPSVVTQVPSSPSKDAQERSTPWIQKQKKDMSKFMIDASAVQANPLIRNSK